MGPGDPWYTVGSQFFKLSCAVDQNKVPVEDKLLGNEVATALDHNGNIVYYKTCGVGRLYLTMLENS